MNGNTTTPAAVIDDFIAILTPQVMMSIAMGIVLMFSWSIAKGMWEPDEAGVR